MDGWLHLVSSGVLVCALIFRIYSLDHRNDPLLDSSHPEYSVGCVDSLTLEDNMPVAMVHQRILGDSTMAIRPNAVSQGTSSNRCTVTEQDTSPIENSLPLDDDFALFQAAMRNNRGAS